MQKIIPIALLLATAFVLVGSSFGMAALAATTTFNDAKAIVVRSGSETVIVNVNSIPGKPGTNGTNGIGIKGDKGDPGKDGINGSSIVGPPGKDGKNGINGTNGVSTICVVTATEQCGLTNSTHAASVPQTNSFTTKNFNCNSVGLAPFTCAPKK